MKILFMTFGFFLFSGNSFGAPNADVLKKLRSLEGRLEAVESAIEKSQCELTYKHFTYRLNRCDKGTFVRAVTDVGSGAKQLECGYYQLRCGGHVK